jgi:hypothetical protein
MSVSSFVRTTPHLQSECDRAFSEGRLRTAGQPNSLGTVAISLANLEGGFWRSLEGNRQHEVRSYVQLGEPPPFLRQDAILRASLRYFPTLRSASLLLARPADNWKPIQGRRRIATPLPPPIPA